MSTGQQLGEGGYRSPPFLRDVPFTCAVWAVRLKLRITSEASYEPYMMR